MLGLPAVGKTDVVITVVAWQTFRHEIYFGTIRASDLIRERVSAAAKPTGEEQAKVKHYFVDSHSITERVECGRLRKALPWTIAATIFGKKDGGWCMRRYLVLYIKAALFEAHRWCGTDRDPKRVT